MKNSVAAAWITASCAAVVIAGAVGTTASLSAANGASSEMHTGVTIAPTSPASVPEVQKAAPAITGPAPLPVEEQGLPG